MDSLAENVAKLSPKQRAVLDRLLKKDGLDLSRLPIVQQSRETNIFPLSFAQQRMWFLQQVEPENATYNCPAALHLVGKLSITALQQTLQELVKRHEALRTTFQMADGHLVQTIAEERDIPLEYADVSDVAEDARSAHLQRLVAQEVQRPFDLASGPLLRTKLFCLGQDAYVLVITLHHIISDGWSLNILVSEMMELYTAYTAGRIPVLPQPTIQYADYAVWQRELLQGARLQPQLTYWKERLADVPALLALPTDRPRPPVQGYRGAFQTFTLPSALSEKLRELSRQAESTVFMTLLAAFNVLLFRYTHEEDILVGTPIANRNRAEVEHIIGCFLNTLVLRNTLSNELSFRQLLAQVRSTTLSAYTNQDLPFEQLVEALHLKRDPGYTPLIQVLFVFQNIKMQALELPDLSLCPFEIEKGTAQFDLTMEVSEEAEGFHGFIEYNTDLFNATTIERMLGHWQTLLNSIVTFPDRRIADLALLTKEEYQAFFVQEHPISIDSPSPIEPGMLALFQQYVQQTPNAVAVTCNYEKLTYGQLHFQANQLAHYLRKTGVQSGVLVGICLERSLAMVVAVLAVLKAGGAYVPLDPSYPLERLNTIIEDAALPVLVGTQDLLTKLSCTGQAVLLDSQRDLIAQESGETPDNQIQMHDVAYVIYTSGSTGRPKGVMVEHYGLGNLARAQVQTFGVNASDHVLQFSSFSFDAWIFETVMALCHGATLCLGKWETLLPGPALAHFLREQEVTIATLTPAALSLLPTDDCPSLKSIISAGEACSAALAARWAKKVQFFNAYGPTETTVWATTMRCLGDDQAPPIGHPILNAHAYVLDTHLQLVPLGVPGELYIAGVGLARGYLHQAALTAEKFIPHPFSEVPGARLYKTGDVVHYRSDGTLEYLDRSDHQVKIRGFRIELGEIETALAQHPAVQECLVIVSGKTLEERRLVAYLVPAVEEVPSHSAFRSYLASRLPDYMLPATFVALAAWPLTPNGKVDRRALPVPDHERPHLQTTFVAPRTQTEQALAVIWQELLGVQQVGIHDNFFESGGHSLLAIQLVSQIQEQLGPYLSLSIVFQSPTIEAMARLLTHQAGMTSWSPLVAIQPAGSRPPFFCIHPAPGNVFCYADLAQYLGLDQPFYGLQSRGIDGQLTPLATIEEMAASYIQEIRTVQPEGPYMLGGHSLGGLVIFEMAQQLRQQDEDVALLAILDTAAPVLKRSEVEEDDREETARLLSGGIALMSQFAGKEVVVPYETLRQMETDDQLEYIRRQMQLGGLLSEKADVRSVRGFLQVQKANNRAGNAYMPSTVYHGTGNVVVLAVEQVLDPDYSEAQRQLYTDASLGWGALVSQDVQACSVPGDHISMLLPPQVQIVAERLRYYLDQAQGKMAL